jgi:hypothetical protein
VSLISARAENRGRRAVGESKADAVVAPLAGQQRISWVEPAVGCLRSLWLRMHDRALMPNFNAIKSRLLVLLSRKSLTTVGKFALGATRWRFGSSGDSDLPGRVVWIFMMGLGRKYGSAPMRRS